MMLDKSTGLDLGGAGATVVAAAGVEQAAAAHQHNIHRAAEPDQPRPLPQPPAGAQPGGARPAGQAVAETSVPSYSFAELSTECRVRKKENSGWY